MSGFESDSGSVLDVQDGVVRRRARRWTPAVHELLRHLETVGFGRAPRVLGLDADGNELLSLIPGTGGAASWAKIVPESGLRAFAALLRSYHDAVAGFEPVATEWATRSGPAGPGAIVCHGDFGPWNTVWRGDEPVGIVDWDLAGPRPPLFDVAYALEYSAPFRDDEECLRWLGYATPPDRARRIDVFAEAYGLASTEELVDAVAAAQEDAIASVRLLAHEGLEPQRTWVAEGHLEELAGRVAWTQANRNLFG